MAKSRGQRVAGIHIDYTAGTVLFEKAARLVRRELSAQGVIINKLRKTMRRWNYRIKKNIFSLKGLRNILFTLVGASAMGAMIKQTADAAKRLHGLSKRINISTKDLTLMFRVFEKGGTLQEETTDALGEFQKRLSEASLGVGEARLALSKLGIELADITRAGQPVTEKIAMIADGIRNLDNQQDRLFAADKLFGGVGLRLIPTLQEGGDAIRATAAELEKFGILTNDEVERLDDLSQAFKNTGHAIKTTFSKYLAKASTVLEKAIEGIGRAVARLGDLANKGDAVKETIIDITRTADGAASMLDRLRSAAADAFENKFPTLFADGILNIAKNADKASDALRGVLQQIVEIALKTAILEPIGRGLGSAISGIIAPGAAPGRAVGGMVSAGNRYTVGESGPETFVPNVGGRIVPNGAGGSVVNVNFNVGDGVSTEMLEARTNELLAFIPEVVRGTVRTENANHSRGFRQGR